MNSTSTAIRALALVSDAYGGHGGIAVYNRDFLGALANHPALERLTVVPRVRHFGESPIPEGIEHIESAIGGKAHYTRALFRQLLRRPAHNLVFCNHINLLPLARMSSALLHTPLVLVIFGIDAWQPTPSHLTNSLVSSVDSVVSISQTTLDRFLEWSNVNPAICHLLPNAIHTRDYGPGAKNPVLLDRYGLQGKKVILTFGRLVSQERSKGFDEVLNVMPRLLREEPELLYLVAGKGEDRDRLERKAADLGVSEHVRFTGFIKEEEKADLYRLADVYAMPSRGEGFGFVFLEAMACGIPVIASTADGSREAVLDGKLGPLVDPDDPDALIQGIREALALKERKVPPGLSYFEFPNFQRRLHEIVDINFPPLKSS